MSFVAIILFPGTGPSPGSCAVLVVMSPPHSPSVSVASVLSLMRMTFLKSPAHLFCSLDLSGVFSWLESGYEPLTWKTT